MLRQDAPLGNLGFAVRRWGDVNCEAARATVKFTDSIESGKRRYRVCSGKISKQRGQTGA
jgi:hypothetical protein